MNTMLTITHKGQVTFSKKILKELGLQPGDKVAVKVTDNQAIIQPVGRGILDLVGKFSSLTLPRGKTLDDLIDESLGEEIEQEIR